MTGVLLLTDQFPPAVGGSGELLFNVYARINGTPVTVLTSGQAATPSLRPSALNVIRRGSPAERWGVLHPAGLLRHTRRAVDMIGLISRAPVLVHCGRALPEGLSAWAVRRLGGPRYLCWAHGEELSYAASSRELRALMRTVYRGASAVVANSRNTADELRAFGLEPERIAVVHPGVDATRFTPEAPGAADLRARLAPRGEALLLTVGRLQRRKGHDLVIEALARLATPTRAVRYVIVGDGAERVRLEQLTARAGLADRVSFIGRVAPEDLPAYYAAADVFVHPNRVDGQDFEGFGIVFLEAAAAGLPVIAGNSGGAPEAVSMGQTGVLVSGLDAAELAAALASLLDDAAKRHEFGRAGRHRVLERFGWDRAAAAVKAVHEATLSR